MFMVEVTMPTDDAKQILFILSVKAGNGKSLGLSRRIQAIYAAAGAGDRVEILLTQHGDHAYDAAAAFADTYGENGIVFICGGDGSSSEVANALANTDCAMGVLPFGTANDFSKILYTKKESKDFDGLLQRTLTPTIRKIDAIYFNGRYALNVISFGFDTIVLQNALKIMRRLLFVGSTGYAFGVVMSLFSKKKFPVAITWVDEHGVEHTLEKTMVLSAIGNGRYYGNGFQPSPNAELDDGLLDFSFAEAMSFFSFISLIKRYRQGTHAGHPKIHVGRGTRGTIRPRAPLTSIFGNSDGIIFDEAELHFEVARDAINFAYI